MRQWKKGQSLVEFALILPLLLIVLLSLIDGALLVQGYLTVHHAAREAARWAIAYQPPQGDCWDANGNGTITDEPWPYCPVPGYQTNAYETDDEYHLRRVQLIKMRGVEATLGLRTEVVCDGVPTDPSSVDSSGCISTTLESEGMLGVQVWGMRAFQDDGTGVPLNLEDHPGLQGLPVQVRVTHNVPLVIFAPLLRRPFVRVSSTAEMINEGVQVGYGNQPPPTLPPPPPINPPGTPPPTVTPQATPTGGPSPTPTPLPVYTIALNFETATNQLPDEREHLVIATVRDPLGQAVSGAQVTFRTSGGSFDYSGIGNTSATRYTGVDGAARIFAYTNRPRAAAIEAWLDYNGDGDIDADEPYDDAVKIWEATGPYLVVSDYNPEPLYWLAIDLMDHPFDDNPYSLWWCPISGTVITEQMAFPVDVAIDTWDAEGIAVQVPEGVTGFYRIESHIGDGGGNACGAGTLVAYSSPIQIADLPPDLIISHMEIDPAVVASGVAPGRPITIIMEIQNLEPVPVTGGPFDIDIYMDLEFSPTVGMLGAAKQWVLTLGPSESAIITDTIIFETMGEHTVWAQIDATDYIDEGPTGEGNNTFGPIETFAFDCVIDLERSDNFDGGLGSQWQSSNIGGSVYGSTAINAAGQLELTSRGSTLFGGNNNFFYVHQSYTDGDYFDVRLRVIDEPTTNQWGKVGIHVRDNTNANAKYVMMMATHAKDPAAEQAVYRSSTGGGASRTTESNDNAIPLPSWMRLVRDDSGQYYYYTSDVAGYPWPDQWTYWGTRSSISGLDYVGIANASYNSSNSGTGVVDDFVFCTDPIADVERPPIQEEFPPGYKQCVDLIEVPGFEGNPDTVYEYWHAGGPGAFSRASYPPYQGSFCMRLHATLGVYPCSQNNFQPYLYQEVIIPTEVYSISTISVLGHYYIARSELECSPGGPDADDVLYLRLQETDGDPITPVDQTHVITTGGAISGTWHTVTTDLSADINLPDYTGQPIRVYWNATHDEDYNGTFFFLDEMRVQVCTEWPIPDAETGMGAIGGLVRALNQYQVPVNMPGADVWAYYQGGEVYHTTVIQDGTYHFYNIAPGTYLIHAQAWVDGVLKTATTEVTITPDEQNFNVNLLLH